jgi:hypothetical protein
MLGAVGMDLAGDIWSTGAFSFESPLKDLLDSGNYTLEQLLAEDELLQELRGCHQQLIQYFSTEQAVTKLVMYVIMQPQQHHSPSVTDASSESILANKKKIVDSEHRNGGTAVPAKLPFTSEPGECLRKHLEKVSVLPPDEPEKDPSLRLIRFPYMACEIICCEIPSIISTLVQGKCVFDTNVAGVLAGPVSTEDDEKMDEPLSTEDVTEIVTSESQGDIVEVVAKPPTIVAETANPESDHDSLSQLSILDLLFSLLVKTPTGQLDDYRAGYFDKVLSVLFRKEPEELTNYINQGGLLGRDVLIQSMFNHLYSHSIMQIAQRLLLPQRPVGQPQQPSPPDASLEGDEIVAGDNDDEAELGVRCDWGNSLDVLDMLLDRLIGPPRTIPPTERSTEEEMQLLDMSLNASEVLITIIQNSMLSSETMLSLTSGEIVARIVEAATTLPDPDYFSPHESMLTSAMNVLESLILQLGGYGAVGTMTYISEEELVDLNKQPEQDSDSGDEVFREDPPRRLQGQIQPADSDDVFNTGQEVGIMDKHLISDLGAMLDHLPTLLQKLSVLLRHPSTESWKSPTQFSKSVPMPILGNSRLRIVRVLESLVLLGDPDVDAKLIESDCLEICLDFFWQFQWCSMLHQSVANLLVHVFEGQNTRYEMQKYFLVKCNLLGRLMDSFIDCEENLVPTTLGNPIPLDSRMSSIVENIQDVSIDLGTATVCSTESEKEAGSSDAPLHVSEDDVDAVMETQGDEKDEDDMNALESNNDIESAAPITMDLVSTDAVRFESRDVSTVSEVHPHPPAQTLRCGYMGHVIIICQALVHAYTNDPHEQEMMEGEGLENAELGILNDNGYSDSAHTPTAFLAINKENVGRIPKPEEESMEGEEMMCPKDIFGEPLLLFEIVNTHVLAEKWHAFVDTTLAAETVVQSTPLGGMMMQAAGIDMMQAHRPGLADEGYMMGDDGEGPPVPPRGMLGGGDVIHMDDHDLDVAASLMAGLRSLGRPSAVEGDEDHSNNSGDSEKSYNSGETASEKTGYAFDDPLGKAGGLGIELGKLTQYTQGVSAAAGAYSGEDDDGSHSSEEEEEDAPEFSSGDVPVMDLFAGNFNYDTTAVDEGSAMVPTAEFANFAEFDAAGTDGLDAGSPVVAVAELPNPDPTADRTRSSELDHLFGSGDHAALLELYDDALVEAAMDAAEPPVTPQPEAWDDDDALIQEAPSDELRAERLKPDDFSSDENLTQPDR